MRRRPSGKQSASNRSSVKYVPSNKEEYLSAAIQENKCISLDEVQEDTDVKGLLLKDGVVLIEEVIPATLIESFLKEVPELIGNHDLLVGLVDCVCYSPKEFEKSTSLQKLSSNKILKKIFKLLDEKMKALLESTSPIEKESFFRCKGKFCSTIEHCDFYHYKKSEYRKYNIFNTEQKEDSVYCLLDSCENPIQTETMSCSCGVWAHKSCFPEPYSPKLNEIWTCYNCSNKEYPIYTAWINLSDIDIDSSVLGVIKGSHKYPGFEVPFNCRDVI